MNLAQARYARLAPFPPAPRGNARTSNPQVLNALHSIAQHETVRRVPPPSAPSTRSPGAGSAGRGMTGSVESASYVGREHAMRLKLKAVARQGLPAKGDRRHRQSFEKLDVRLLGRIHTARIFDVLRACEQAPATP